MTRNIGTLLTISVSIKEVSTRPFTCGDSACELQPLGISVAPPLEVDKDYSTALPELLQVTLHALYPHLHHNSLNVFRRVSLPELKPFD